MRAVAERRVIEESPAPAADAPAGADRRRAPRRVLAFLVERFPPVPQLVLMTVLFVAGTLMSDVLLEPELDRRLGDIDPLRALCGFAASLLFVVRLRVYDDVKDAETDRVEHPDRPIPRGLVSVRELDSAALMLLALEAACVGYVGPLAVATWAAAAGWSVLMRVEFFVPRWLERHVATYAISHMVVMGLVFGMLLAIGIEARGGSEPLQQFVTHGQVLTAMLGATLIGIGFEWGRKFERYLAAHGERGWELWLLWPSLGGIVFTLLARDAYPLWATMAVAGVTLFTIGGHALVMGQRERPATRGAESAPPTGALREAVEAAPGIAGLLLYAVLAAAGIVELVT